MDWGPYGTGHGQQLLQLSSGITLWVHLLPSVNPLMVAFCSGLELITNWINLFRHQLLLVNRFYDRGLLALSHLLFLTRSRTPYVWSRPTDR